MADRFRLLPLLLCLAVCAACQRAPATSALDIDLEDLGTGVRLLDHASDLASASYATTGPELRVLTPDELAQADPYRTRAVGRDLVLAIIKSELDGTASQRVAALRCYLAPTSVLTLQGQPLRQIDPDQADRLLLTKGERIQTSGETHLSYSFTSKTGYSTKLTLSLRDGEGCYAAELFLYRYPGRPIPGSF